MALPAPSLGSGPAPLNQTFHGVVRSAIPGRVVVLRAGGPDVACLVPKALTASTGKLVVGDRVRWRFADGATPGNDGTIERVLERRTVLARRAAGRKGGEQVLAANVDLLLAVFAAAEPEPKWGMLDRYLTLAESAKITPLIVVTKMELADRGALGNELERYHALGYRSVLVSVRTGEGVDALRAEVAGRVSVLSGKSGVGKTTLFNALIPNAAERTGHVSEMTGKGRHTTSAAMLWPLAPGSSTLRADELEESARRADPPESDPLPHGALIDTPGVRELGLWEIDPIDLASCFPEIRPLLGSCRFAGSCTHTHEIGCTVKAAVEKGRIHPLRYQAYCRMLSDQDA